MFKSVKIDDKDMYETYGCILADKTIGQPKAKTKFVDVPLRDGSIDLTEELSDLVRYENREIEITFLYLGDNRTKTMTEIARNLNGRKVKIQFDDDFGFYYVGRISLDITSKDHASTIKIKADCEPFKYDVNESDMDWDWDSFDFEDGIVNEAGEIVVSGETHFTLLCRRTREFPTFTASADMTMSFKGVTHSLKAGSQKLYRVFFDEGENEMVFNGSGTVSIKYRGGSL